jgi:uncharacterized membrane protein
VRDPRVLGIAALGAASPLCLATVEYRIHRTGDAYYRFLVWNLFLAWVPLGLALAVLWLLFFPNAPYMLTDFVHLGESPAVPVWYDALMLTSFAWTALLLGYASLYLVQIVVRRRAGQVASWIAVAVALGLASFGVYLGRFVRLNSWDAVLHPHRVARLVHAQVENPLQHPRMVAVLLVLAVFLLVGYLVLYAFAGLRLQLERGPADPR